MSDAILGARAVRAIGEVDSMPADLRQCVHEYGYAIVNSCINAGVTRPAIVHQLVREIWEGARASRQGRTRSGMLDWLLLQAGAEITAAELCRVLRHSNLVILPLSPTKKMIEASMAEVSGGNERMTKRDKHIRRLIAALKSEENYFEAIAKHAVGSPA